MINLTPSFIEVIPARDKIQLPKPEIDMNILLNARVKKGVGEENFQTGPEGLWLGAADYDGSPFKVDRKGNLIAGSLFYSRQSVFTSFESSDGWVNPTHITIALGGSNMQTGNVINTKKTIYDEVALGDVDFNNKNPTFQTVLGTTSITNQTIYFGCGALYVGDNTEEGFGFKIVNGTLSALHTINDGATATEYLTTITGITLTVMNNYRAILTSGEKIEFFVNGVLKATQTTNLTFNGTNAFLMNFHIENTEAANKGIYLRYAMFAQDN